MGTLLFGRSETITCITDVPVVGKHNEPLCLAYKTTKTFVGAGVWMTDDGYVLRARGSTLNGEGNGMYYPLSATDLAELQANHEVPAPLPAYTIPWYEWAAATSLYWMVAFVVAFSFVAGRFKAKRRARFEEELRARRVSFGPPTLRTKTDQHIHEQLAPILEAGEMVLHQAHALDRDPTDGTMAAAAARQIYVALTSRRLLLLLTKKGLRAEQAVEHVEAIERDRLVSLRLDDEALLTFVLDDGTGRTLFITGFSVKDSNERAFLLDVPRILAGEVEEPAYGEGAPAPPPRELPPLPPRPPTPARLDRAPPPG